MNLDHNTLIGAKLSALSVATSVASVPLDDATALGQVVAIVVSIISGIASLVKLFKRKK